MLDHILKLDLVTQWAKLSDDANQLQELTTYQEDRTCTITGKSWGGWCVYLYQQQMIY